MKEKPYPCCSAIPAQTTFADAPINVPLPAVQKINTSLQLCSVCHPSSVYSALNSQDVLEKKNPFLLHRLENIQTMSPHSIKTSCFEI